MSQQNKRSQAPIGYWLKRADEAITKYANQVLNEKGFTRFCWQVLNSLYENGSSTKSDLYDGVKSFINVQQLDEILDSSIQQGWIVKSGEGDEIELRITDSGKAEREAIFQLQREVRQRTRQGITDEEYTIVIDVLQRLVKNLE